MPIVTTRIVPYVPQPEAERSWWLESTTREDFKAAIEREAERMKRSPIAAKLTNPMIVGYCERKSR